MTSSSLIRRSIFGLAIAFFGFTLVGIFLASALGLECINSNVKDHVIGCFVIGMPIAILMTMARTVKKKNKRSENLTALILTTIGAVGCFFLLGMAAFSTSWGGWVNETILFRSKENRNITVSEQIYDQGALGYGGHRIVICEPFLKYFQKIKAVDTATIDKEKWLFVNEEGDIHFP